MPRGSVTQFVIFIFSFEKFSNYYLLEKILVANVFATLKIKNKLLKEGFITKEINAKKFQGDKTFETNFSCMYLYICNLYIKYLTVFRNSSAFH